MLVGALPVGTVPMTRFVRLEQQADIGPVHQAHVDEEVAVDLAEVMNGDDVRVAQSLRDVRFTLESLAVLLVTGERLGEELEGDMPLTLRVVRLIDFPHSAGTEQAVKVIVADLPCGHENRPQINHRISRCATGGRANVNR